MGDTYKIIDDFQENGGRRRILVLERDFSSFDLAEKWLLKIDDVEYEFEVESIPNWVSIESEERFAGKHAEVL